MSGDAFGGHCLCGAVAYTVNAAPNWVGHCHCSDCRRHTASAVATYVGCNKDAFALTSGEMARYESSPGVWRFFCPTCGTPMAYEAQAMPGEIHLLLGTLDAPEAMPAQVEVFCKEKLPWLKLEVDGPGFDALPES